MSIEKLLLLALIAGKQRRPVVRERAAVIKALSGGRWLLGLVAAPPGKAIVDWRCA